MLYFAYGSNLDWHQIEDRCPSVTYVGRARLTGYRLDFTHYSTNRNCGVADIVEEPSSVVWGVLYDIPKQEDIEELDRSEGYRTNRPREENVYDRITLAVDQVDDDGEATATREAQVYVVVHKHPGERPDAHYLGLIVNGGRYYGLPDEYVDQVARTPLQAPD